MSLCLLHSILSTVEQQPVGLSFSRIEKIIVFQRLYEFFWNRRDEKRLGLDSKTLTESLRMSTQSDVERFIPGTNVVYDNEIYTRLFL